MDSDARIDDADLEISLMEHPLITAPRRRSRLISPAILGVFGVMFIVGFAQLQKRNSGADPRPALVLDGLDGLPLEDQGALAELQSQPSTLFQLAGAVAPAHTPSSPAVHPVRHINLLLLSSNTSDSRAPQCMPLPPSVTYTILFHWHCPACSPGRHRC